LLPPNFFRARKKIVFLSTERYFPIPLQKRLSPSLSEIGITVEQIPSFLSSLFARNGRIHFCLVIENKVSDSRMKERDREEEKR
jgi:hypothetical protein